MGQSYEEAAATLNSIKSFHTKSDAISAKINEIERNLNITAIDRVYLMTPLMKESNNLRKELMKTLIDTGDPIYDDAIKKLRDTLPGHDLVDR